MPESALEVSGSEGVPDVVAPPPRHPRFPLIDGMRAIAVLSVVAVHSWLAARGGVGETFADRLLAHLNVGVTIFFVISGFLLYRPFIAHRAGGATAPGVPDYAKRRFLRVYPAYWLVLTVLTVIPGLIGVYGDNWWQQYAIVDALPVHHGSACSQAIFDCGLAQTWSLVVEVTFYVALPLYVLASRRLLRGLKLRDWLAAQLLLLGALSVVSIVARFGIGSSSSAWIDTSVAGSVFWFALGMALAVISVGLEASSETIRKSRWLDLNPLLPWVGAAGVYVGLSLWLPVTPFVLDRGDQLVAHVAFGVIALLLMLPAVFGHHAVGLPRRLLANRVVAWLGLISYGIFLWHYVVTLQLDGGGTPLPVVLLVTLAVSVACAAASYYVVERPLLRLKYRRLRALPRPDRRAVVRR
jgi:peptidoglycan/LPS O-acetylase OafA/YrhL